MSCGDACSCHGGASAKAAPAAATGKAPAPMPATPPATPSTTAATKKPAESAAPAVASTGGAPGSEPKLRLYRRPLPDTCIDFASPEGRKLFVSALESGGMECYFQLAAQFRQQAHPAYCGLSTLTMVLNALAIDPGRLWKGPWKWFDETMLDCCESLETIQKNGITWDKWVCLAMCNGADIEAKRASESTLEELRDVVRAACAQDKCFMVASYSRAALGQTGDGHFSPVGGYDAATDSVLLLDVAKFKYPPHWVSLELFWRSLNGIDKVTGKTRGFALLRKPENQSLLLFHVFLMAQTSASEKEKAIVRDLSSHLAHLPAVLKRKADMEAALEMQLSGSEFAPPPPTLTERQAVRKGLELFSTALGAGPIAEVMTVLNDAYLSSLPAEHATAITAMLRDMETLPLYKALAHYCFPTASTGGTTPDTGADDDSGSAGGHCSLCACSGKDHAALSCGAGSGGDASPADPVDDDSGGGGSDGSVCCCLGSLNCAHVATAMLLSSPPDKWFEGARAGTMPQPLTALKALCQRSVEAADALPRKDLAEELRLLQSQVKVMRTGMGVELPPMLTGKPARKPSRCGSC